MRWNRRCTSASRNCQTNWSITPIGGRNTFPIGTPNDWLEAGIESSVGSRGDSYDNALAETINGLYKAALIHRRGPWKSRESVQLATLQWVHWFNNIRLLEPIGYIPPAEAEANYWRQLAQQTETASSTQTSQPP